MPNHHTRYPDELRDRAVRMVFDHGPPRTSLHCEPYSCQGKVDLRVWFQGRFG